VTYGITWTARARRDLQERLPEKVAVACWEFVQGPLAEDPHRVGKRLKPPMDDRWTARRGEYRVIYRIDDGNVVVEVVALAHRRDAYRR
jgi:mRNA-degrading endonuclease RelE of RelBE toxin-antitoxin system